MESPGTLWLPQYNKAQVQLLVSLAALPGFNPVWFRTHKIPTFLPSRALRLHFFSATFVTCNIFDSVC